jgi:hypothetical protein
VELDAKSKLYKNSSPSIYICVIPKIIIQRDGEVVGDLNLVFKFGGLSVMML